MSAKHQRILRRVHVEPDNIADLLDKLRVLRNLEALHSMRLQSDSATRFFSLRRRSVLNTGVFSCAAPMKTTPSAFLNFFRCSEEQTGKAVA